MFKNLLRGKQKESFLEFETTQEVIDYYSVAGYKVISSGNSDRVKMAYKMMDGVIILSWDIVQKKVSILPLTREELQAATLVFDLPEIL